MAVDKKVFSEFYSKKKNDVYYINNEINKKRSRYSLHES